MCQRSDSNHVLTNTEWLLPRAALTRCFTRLPKYLYDTDYVDGERFNLCSLIFFITVTVSHCQRQRLPSRVISFGLSLEFRFQPLFLWYVTWLRLAFYGAFIYLTEMKWTQLDWAGQRETIGSVYTECPDSDQFSSVNLHFLTNRLVRFVVDLLCIMLINS